MMGKRKKLILSVFLVIGIGFGYWLYMPTSQFGSVTNQSSFSMGLFPFGAPPPISQSELQKNLPDYYSIKTDVTMGKNDRFGTFSTKLKATLLEKKEYPHNLDKLVLPFLRDKNISRADKINVLWDIFKAQDIESNQAQYLLDALAILQPIELTESLIEIFNGNISDVRKSQLLRVLSDATGISTLEFIENKSTTEAQRQYVTDQIDKVQVFVRQNLVTEASSVLFSDVYEAATRNLSSDEIFTITSTLTDTQKKAVGQRKLTEVMVMNAFASGESMDGKISQLLNTQFSSADEKKLFDDQLYARISLFAPSEIPDASREQLVEYLSSNLPGADKATYTYDDSVINYQWVNAYHKLSANTPVEAAKLLINVVTQTSNPLTQAAIITSAPLDSGFAIGLVQDSQWLNVQSNLHAASMDTNISAAGKDLIKEALNELERVKESSHQ